MNQCGYSSEGVQRLILGQKIWHRGAAGVGRNTQTQLSRPSAFGKIKQGQCQPDTEMVSCGVRSGDPFTHLNVPSASQAALNVYRHKLKGNHLTVLRLGHTKKFQT